MRAIIKCSTNVDVNKLDGLLAEKGWWPNLAQNHDEIEKRKREVLSHVAADDLVMVEETVLYTIFDDITNSWGIVSNPTQHSIAFRLKNRDSERLKLATERLVSNLQSLSHSSRRGSGEESVKFTFVGKIEVLEPNSEDHAYYGEVLPINRFSYARRKRSTEFWVGVLAAIAGLSLLVITFPPIASNALVNLSPEWQVYIKGLVDRLGTSAIVTATVSLLNVVLYWFNLRRKSVIIWNV